MMRPFDIKDVYSWANRDELKLAIYGYVGNSISDLACNIAPDGKVQLLSIDENSALCFNVENKQDNLAKVYHFAFFLPADKVKRAEEKKWKAFEDFNEFKIWTNKSVGSVIVYRDKLTHDELEAVITRSKLYENFVEIGAVQYTFKELFDQWEWLNPRNEWQPFGILEK